MPGLGALIEARAATPSAHYLEDARSDATLTYGQLFAELHRWIPRFTALLGEHGVVVVDIADPIGFARVYLSAIAGGYHAIPADPALDAEGLNRILTLVEGEPTVVVSDHPQDRQLSGTELLPLDTSDAAELDHTVPHRASAGSAGARPGGAALLFTSGSTGTPKGVPLGVDQLLTVAYEVAEHNKLTPDDRGFNPLPLFHVNAEVVGLLATLVAGSTLILDRRFHATGFWDLIDQREITWINAVPAILAVLAHTGPLRVPSRVRFIRSASAPLPEAVRHQLAEVPLVVSYGMTEGASQITATPLGEPIREGSVGKPVGCELQIRTDAGPAPTGTIGDIWIRGRGVIHSYYGGRAADRFDPDGWLRTGDLGKLDGDGYVYLVGRSDDVINRGGEMVYPADIEEILLEDPRVREAVVVGRPDPVLHQVPTAYVIPADLTQPAETLAVDLTQRCETHLPKYKRPVHIDIVEDLPRAATGKIRRAQVRHLAASA